MSSLGVFGSIGAIIGGILFLLVYGSGEGLLTGAVLGFLLAWNIILSRAWGRADKQISIYVDEIAELKRAVNDVEQEDSVRSSVEKKVKEHSSQAVAQPLVRRKAPPLSTKPAPTPEPSFFDRGLNVLKRFFTQGNVVLRVGLLILFFGVAFLLKYAAERSILPIELRLLGVALCGIGMLVFGWRLRTKRPGFGLLMQGGGIGILFLTVFASAKLYDLLPMGLSLGILLGLVAASTALALLQDARSLALFGAAGGFLAPVLLSTGSGSHLALFSFYALLNTGILTISWFKSWRELNLLGFVFTLAIATLWGAQAYQPKYFATTEPFLILFFLMFTIIGVLFAFRQPPKLRGYLDGSLIFGTPIICFSLQAALVKDMQYGMAISALVISLFYVGLASFLWNKGDKRLRQGMRTLTEAFLALGVVFVTLAVPLALSGSWTAVTWAMEGAALVWVGVRQHRVIPRNFGFLLQLGAGFFFLLDADFNQSRLILFNGVFLGSLVIGLSGLFSSLTLYRADKLYQFEKLHHLLLFCWGAVWCFAAAIIEAEQQVSYQYEDYSILLVFGAGCLLMASMIQRLEWRILAWPSLILLPVMAWTTLDHIGVPIISASHHLFGNLGYAAWPISCLILYRCLFLIRDVLPEKPMQVTHGGAFLLITLILTAETAWQVNQCASTSPTWNFIFWGLVPVAMVRLVQTIVADLWPISSYKDQYQKHAAAIILILAWFWLLAGCLTNPGDPAPLPFIPIFNPLEISQLVVFFMLVLWTRDHFSFLTSMMPKKLILGTGGITAFIWINTVLARAVHQLTGVSFSPPPMLDSRLYQASLSILWGMLALAVMTAARRYQSRTVWFVGCGLIGATVLKLILVDLASSGTVERIVSFLAVGILLMVIGWFSPLPPAQSSQEDES